MKNSFFPLDSFTQTAQNRLKWSKVEQSGQTKRNEKLYKNMLIGQYPGTIGEKNRVAFPKKFVLQMGRKLIITQGFEGSLIVVSEHSWKTLLSGTEGMPLTDLSTRETQRFLLGTATEVELDSKGRFVMPAHLKSYGGLIQDLIFLGINSYVEIWDKNKWEKHNSELIGKVSGIADRLGRSGDK